MEILQFINVLQKKFPREVEIQETENNYLLEEGTLVFGEKNHNNYLVLFPEKYEKIRVEIFYSDKISFNKIEKDYLNLSFDFDFTNLEDFKTFIKTIK